MEEFNFNPSIPFRVSRLSFKLLLTSSLWSVLHVQKHSRCVQHELFSNQSTAVLESRSRSIKTNREDWQTGGKPRDESVHSGRIYDSFRHLCTHYDCVSSIDFDGVWLRHLVRLRTRWLGPLSGRSIFPPSGDGTWVRIIVFRLALLGSILATEPIGISRVKKRLWGE